MGCAAVGFAGVSAGLGARAEEKGFIQTVLGPIAPEKFGFALPHEHVICDFIGADKTGRDRWDVDAVVARMLPVLGELKQRGVTGFVDCTPAYIGRDPRILQKIARESGLHIVTNTGYYGGAGDKYVPKHAYSESADQLAARWVGEWKNGIEGTGVKPGFMKIGVDEAKEDRLSEIDEKLARAAARASLQTGLSVVCHTGGGPAGLRATKIFISEKARADRFVVAHSDGHGLHINEQVAELGAWISFDGISRRPIEQHLKLVTAIVEKHADRLLLSHDNGWYNVGQPNGGEVRDFNYLADTFLPALRANGVSEPVVRQLTVGNPAKAFTIAA
ncbi:MAG TPA: phosphotriesterase [Verrucomicrobiae bacterium]|nr:phosphotriesterase [Verrucomicrobiae bacterium]